MPLLPDGLSTATISGHFPLGDGSPASGYIKFRPSSDLVDANGEVLIPAVPVRRRVVEGVMEPLTYVRTDNAGLFPQGWTLIVTHHLAGAAIREYSINLVGDIDLSSVSEVHPAVQQTSYVRTTGDTMTGTLVLGADPPLRVPDGATEGLVWTAVDDRGNGQWIAPSGGGFVYDIPSSVSSITVTHGLGRYPNVSFVDTSGVVQIPDATHVDVNSVYLVFSAPTTGTVVCS